MLPSFAVTVVTGTGPIMPRRLGAVAAFVSPRRSTAKNSNANRKRTTTQTQRCRFFGLERVSFDESGSRDALDSLSFGSMSSWCIHSLKSADAPKNIFWVRRLYHASFVPPAGLAPKLRPVWGRNFDQHTPILGNTRLRRACNPAAYVRCLLSCNEVLQSATGLLRFVKTHGM